MKDSKNIQKTGGEQGKITACFCRFAEKNIYTSYVLKAENPIVIAVSYTHLDVYKRQLSAGTEWFSEIFRVLLSVNTWRTGKCF